MEEGKKDLCVDVDGTILNIRVLVIMNTPKGYIFEKHKEGFYFAIGGRIKINESSIEACSREIFEELELVNVSVKMVGIVENFFKMDGNNYHEINMVFKSDLDNAPDLEALKGNSNQDGYVYIDSKGLDEFNIKPKILPELFRSDKDFVHLVNRD